MGLEGAVAALMLACVIIYTLASLKTWLPCTIYVAGYMLYYCYCNHLLHYVLVYFSLAINMYLLLTLPCVITSAHNRTCLPPSTDTVQHILQ
jgi:hypothetical protein